MTRAPGPGSRSGSVGNLSGCWSRRIDQEHCLVHTVDGEQLVVLQARYHY